MKIRIRKLWNFLLKQFRGSLHLKVHYCSVTRDIASDPWSLGIIDYPVLYRNVYIAQLDQVISGLCHFSAYVGFLLTGLMHSNVGTVLLVVRQIFLDVCKLKLWSIIIIIECINILICSIGVCCLHLVCLVKALKKCWCL